MAISLFAISTTFGQNRYKISYAELKTYQGTYQYSDHKTLQILASPVDTMLYAMIGDAMYKLRPYNKDVFLNNGNNQVQFFRTDSKITGYKQQNEKPDTIYKLLSTNVTISGNMWYPKPITGKHYVYNYTIPVQRNDGLTTGSIQHSGLDTALIRTLMNRIVSGTYPGIHSILIIKDGKLVVEEYFYGNDIDKLHELRSATKSFSSALVGIAIQKGLIKSIDDTMVNYFPGYKMNNFEAQKKAISIKNLLTQQSGFACYDYDPKSPGNENSIYPTSNWIQTVLNLPMATQPGTVSSYCSGNIMLLDQIVQNVSHQRLHQFAAENLFNYLEVANFKWDFIPDKSHEDDFGEVCLTSRDMAKFGLLYLNGGAWNGKQVIAKDYIKQSLTKQSVVEGINYGYLWWCEDLTANGKIYTGMAAKGNGGQRIFIWPDQHIVAVVTAGNYNTQSPANKLLIECVLGGLK